MLTAGHGTHDQIGLSAADDRLGQRRIRLLVGQVQFAGEEPDERPPPPAVMIADTAAQHRVAGLQCVQHRSLGYRSVDLQLHLAVDVRERPQVGREHHPDHDSVWTSTDSTAGRSRTIGAQVSPASADAGDNWAPIVRDLPAVLSVEAQTLS